MDFVARRLAHGERVSGLAGHGVGCRIVDVAIADTDSLGWIVVLLSVASRPTRLSSVGSVVPTATAESCVVLASY